MLVAVVFATCVVFGFGWKLGMILADEFAYTVLPSQKRVLLDAWDLARDLARALARRGRRRSSNQPPQQLAASVEQPTN